MVPWVLVYGFNILGLFAGAIVAFYQMEGSLKSLGVVPLFWGTFILMGHILVMVRIIGSSNAILASTEHSLPRNSHFWQCWVFVELIFGL